MHKLPNGKHHAAITGSDVNYVNSRTLKLPPFFEVMGRERELFGIYKFLLELSTSRVFNSTIILQTQEVDGFISFVEASGLAEEALQVLRARALLQLAAPLQLMALSRALMRLLDCIFTYRKPEIC